MCLSGLALAVSVLSVHHTSGEFNETNPGIGVEAPVGECGYVSAGFYENSYNDTTYYAGGGLDLSLNNYVNVGVLAVATYGYHKQFDFKSNIIPMAGLTATVSVDRVAVKAIHVPFTVTGAVWILTTSL